MSVGGFHITVGDELRSLADTFDSISRQISDLHDRQVQEIESLQRKLNEMEEQRDDARAQVADFEALKEVVWSFFDMLESPSPAYHERALDEFRGLCRGLGVIS